LVLFRLEDPAKPTGGFAPLGSEREFVALLEPFNTGPDGSPRRTGGTEVLHGPGIVVEYATTQENIAQAIVTVVDQDVAWPVLSRICRTLGWKLQDMESGQTFG
jgi:hypothetical protein